MVALVTVREARDRLGVSREKMRKLIKAGTFTTYENPVDQRSKLIDTDELDAFLSNPKPINRKDSDNART